MTSSVSWVAIGQCLGYHINVPLIWRQLDAHVCLLACWVSRGQLICRSGCSHFRFEQFLQPSFQYINLTLSGEQLWNLFNDFVRSIVCFGRLRNRQRSVLFINKKCQVIRILFLSTVTLFELKTGHKGLQRARSLASVCFDSLILSMSLWSPRLCRILWHKSV